VDKFRDHKFMVDSAAASLFVLARACVCVWPFAHLSMGEDRCMYEKILPYRTQVTLEYSC